MQLNILKLILLCLIGNIQSHGFCQKISSKEYQVINDLFGEKSGPENFNLYINPAPYSVFEMLMNQNPNSIDSPVEIDPEEFRTLMERLQTQKKNLDDSSEKSYEWEKRFLDHKIKLKRKPHKGNLISRPIILGNYSILYIKTYKNSYIEEYIISKKNNENWERYGSYFISSKIIDILVK